MKWIIMLGALIWLGLAIAMVISIGRAIHGGRKGVNERRHPR